jgi:anoctamin-10
LWCIVFTEYWKHQETDLAVRWGVRNVSKIESRRREFNHDKVITDPVTGEQVRAFSNTKRLQRQLLQVPFALGVASVLGSLIATCFGIEVFISEVYDGPLKWILVFLPTGILTTVMPVLVNLFTTFATQLTDFENYDTQAAYDTAMTQKIFVINFITSYLGIFLTAFVYVPFGTLIVPYLDIFSLTVKPFAENEKQMEVPPSHAFEINPDRLRKQVIYFTVTAQIVNQALEVVMPFVKRRISSKVKQIKTERAMSNGGAVDISENDQPEEKAFLARVRQEAELDVYDVTSDLREMVLQVGYPSLASTSDTNPA